MIDRKRKEQESAEAISGLKSVYIILKSRQTEKKVSTYISKVDTQT